MGAYALSMKKGTDQSYNFIFTDSSGDPIDITGWTIYFMVKDDINDTDAEALITKTVTTHTSPTTGRSSLTIDREDTENLDYGKYTYDFQLIKSDGNRIGTTVDDFNITPSVRLED